MQKPLDERLLYFAKRFTSCLSFHSRMSHRRTLDAILSGTSDYNIQFNEMTGMLRAMGFHERIRGSHHMYSLKGVKELIDLQPENGMVKAYQVRQVRKIFLNHGLTGLL